MRRRATSSEERQQKETRILAAAERLLGHMRYRDVTVHAIATEAGEAKGTIYLYFRSKEDLFVALLELELTRWADDACATLAGEGSSVSPASLARLLTASLSERASFVRLLALSQAILEENASRERATGYKRALLTVAERVSRSLALACDWMSAEAGGRLMVFLYALVVGLYYQTNPAPVVREVIAAEGMRIFDLDFEQELERHLTTYLNGLPRTREGA
ncbi:MAG: TetR/AcrR family transcriptional regulator [Spirochaetota bacterium]